MNINKEKLEINRLNGDLASNFENWDSVND